jgi:hypothetical protein
MCWFVIDWFFVAIFTVEFGLRQILYFKEGRHTEFWTDALNVIDFIAILPSYIELFQWIALGKKGKKTPLHKTLFTKLYIFFFTSFHSRFSKIRSTRRIIFKINEIGQMYTCL